MSLLASAGCPPSRSTAIHGLVKQTIEVSRSIHDPHAPNTANHLSKNNEGPEEKSYIFSWFAKGDGDISGILLLTHF